jgi:uncharacterized protein
MKRLLTTLVILTVLFAPSLAVAEEVKIDDLVETDGLFYKKFSTEPFTGKTEGRKQYTFRRGKKHGPYAFFYENGRVEYTGNFKNGYQDGLQKGFFESGELNTKGVVSDRGRLVVNEMYFKNGRLREKVILKRSKGDGYPGEGWDIGPHGPVVAYHENGQLSAKGTYKDGKGEGPWLYYHENGQLYAKGTYLNDKKEGFVIFYNRDGTKDMDGKCCENHEGSGTYRNGKKVSD